MDEIAHGYLGLFTQTTAHKQYGSCIYTVAIPGKGELNIFLLAPGNFMDAYTLAKSPTYQDIHIFPSQLDAFYLSDVYRLVVELRKFKEKVTVHFPVKPKFLTEYEYDDVFLFNFDTTPYYQSKADSRVYVEFDTDITIDCLCFGMMIYNGKERIHIVPYLEESMLDSLELDSLSEECQLHIPYYPNEYGGMCWHDMFKSRKYNMKYIVPYKFNNWEEFQEAKIKAKMMPKRFGYGIRPII